MSLRIIATCAVGLEDLLAGELGELGLQRVRTERGAASFEGGWHDVWRANWRLRTANRVLVELAVWTVTEDHDLTRGVERVVASDRRWDGLEAGELFDPRRTFALRSTTMRSPIRDTRWVSLKAKDGLVDAQRRRFGRRASVERDEPDLPLRIRLLDDRATLLLDTSGRSLDHRGYRTKAGQAPLREQLAAACVLAADWDGDGPVLDPMCGSGTLLAEAAAWGRGLAPARLRRRWAFERFPGFEREGWRRIRQEPIPAPAPQVRILGVDRSAAEVRLARASLEKAGLAAAATVERGDAFTFPPPAEPGLVLLNPPYGERLSESGGDLMPRLGDLLKQRYKGWRAVVLAGDKDRGKHIGLRPKRRIPVRNGPLDARILVFDLY